MTEVLSLEPVDPPGAIEGTGGLKDTGGEDMKARWECMTCGYVYDPEKGDPDSGVAPGTAFEDLPDDWTCPVCGASKEMFEKLADHGG